MFFFNLIVYVFLKEIKIEKKNYTCTYSMTGHFMYKNPFCFYTVNHASTHLVRIHTRSSIIEEFLIGVQYDGMDTQYQFVTGNQPGET